MRDSISIIVLLLCAMATASCAMNQEKREFSYFRAGQKSSESFEVPETVEIAHLRVQQGARDCYAAEAQSGMTMVGGLFVATPGAATTVETQTFEDAGRTGMSTRVGAGNAVNYVPIFQVDILPTAAGSEVKLYYEFRDELSDGRKRADVAAWITGDIAHCSIRKR